MEQTWQTQLIVPAYMVEKLGSAGREETWEDNNYVDSDNLAVTLETMQGYQILLPGYSRLVLCNNGNVEIQVLKPVMENSRVQGKV
jgi:hypothetical protein